MLLSEMFSETPLYHFARYSIERILLADRLGVDREGSVSLTRDQNLPFRDDAQAILVLNRARLLHNHSLSPSYGDSRETALISTPRDESEERVRGIIAPLHRYLDSIVLSPKLADEVAELRRIREKPAAEHDAYEVAMMRHLPVAAAVLDYTTTYGIPLRRKEDGDRAWALRQRPL